MQALNAIFVGLTRAALLKDIAFLQVPQRDQGTRLRAIDRACRHN